MAGECGSVLVPLEFLEQETKERSARAGKEGRTVLSVCSALARSHTGTVGDRQLAA